MNADEAGRHVVLITGASRGIGAELARQLGDSRRHIVVHYREKTRRADEVVEEIRAAGGHASSAQADLCDPGAVDRLLGDIAAQFGRLDVLVLNASGGMERHAAVDHAMRVNRDAQTDTARKAVPLMAPGGRIVYVTSHQAHYYDQVAVPAVYEPVAASKFAGEQALQGMRAMFGDKGIDLVTVSGDMVEGTYVVRLLERADPDAVTARRAGGPLPTVAEFAAAIAEAVESTDRGGATVLVGGADYLR